MAGNVTIADLRTRIRDVTDTDTTAPTNDHVPDAFLLRRINVHGAALHGMLCKATPDYKADECSFASVVDQRQYPLPADFYQMVSVRVTDGNLVCSVNRFDPGSQLAMLDQLENIGSANVYNYMYRIVRDQIEIRPSPKTASHTFTLVFNPLYVDRIDDEQTIDGINGWEEFIVQSTAVDVAIREEGDPGGHMAKAQMLAAEIAELATSRDQAPDFIQDAERDYYPFPDRPLGWSRTT